MKKNFFLFLAFTLPLLATWFFKKPAFSKYQEQQFSKKYERVVSMAPSFCESMVSIGQGHRLVGVTNHCPEPTLKRVKRIGTFASANFEAILELNPDLVLAVPHIMAQPILEQLRKNHIQVFTHQPDSLSDIKFILRHLGELFAAESEAQEQVDALEKSIRQAKDLLGSNIKSDDKKSFLLSYSSTPLVVAGKNTFSSEILLSLGMVNHANDSLSTWPIWSVEDLLKNPPNYFVLAEGEASKSNYRDLLDLLQKESLAIKVIIPKQAVLSSPSPKLINDIKYITHLINNNEEI